MPVKKNITHIILTDMAAWFDSEKIKRLKQGFILLFITTITLTIQFVLYLPDNISWGGIFYYLIAAFGQAVLISAIPFIAIFLPIAIGTKFYKTGLGLYFFIGFLLNILIYINGIVFQLYKFHINGFVLSLLFGEGAGEVFVFNSTLIWQVTGIIALILGIFLFISYTGLKLHRYVTGRYVRIYSLIAILCIVSSHLVHAYAAATGKYSIQNVARFLPQFYPLTANSLMLELGVVQRDDLYIEDKSGNASVNYPLNALEISNDSCQKNIVFIVLDSWNPRTFNADICPNITKFGERGLVFQNHLSSSCGTRGGIFGLFFGVSSCYWKDFEIGGVQPLFIRTMLDEGYAVKAFPSASLDGVPFYRIVFGDVKDIRIDTPGDTPFDRDIKITDDFIEFLDQQKVDSTGKPFFSLVFYDLLHAIEIPAEHRVKFQPSWEFANYIKLNNDLDPTPFFNLYKNCAWYVDSLVGQVIHKLEENDMLKNTIVVVTGDHGQEFNENHKNFWGHGSNFSNSQIHVPMIYFDNTLAPRTYFHRTTHYDVVPTLMHNILGVKNPTEDYSMGRLMTDSIRLPFHIAGSPDNYAFIMDNVIYEQKTGGAVAITDSCLNEIPRSEINTPLLLEAINYKNRFYKKN